MKPDSEKTKQELCEEILRLRQEVEAAEVLREVLAESEMKYRRIVETAAEGFVMTDQDMTITDVNKAYCRMTGYSRKELIGMQTLDLADAASRTYMEHNRERILSKEYRVFEMSGLAKDGSPLAVLIHSNTLRDDEGEILGNIAFVTDLRRQKKALELAREVQKSLLPQKKPEIAGLDIAGQNRPCREVGGDYFDFLYPDRVAGSTFHAVIGDISGHGVDSALLMASARAFLRMRASQTGDIGEIVTAANHHLTSDVFDSGRFMTLFYLSIFPDSGRGDWVRAGHDPAMLYKASTGEFEELKGEGVAIGLQDDVRYRAASVTGLQRNDILVLYTDGIWEESNMEGEMFGKHRLRACIAANAENGAEQIQKSVFKELEHFTVGCRPADDATLIIIKVL